LRRHSRGRVIARHVLRTGKAFLQRLDHKVAALNEGIFRPVGVILEFMITPAVAADLVFPLCCVGTRTVGPIELVAPNESPPVFSCLRRSISSCGSAGGQRCEQGHEGQERISVVQIRISFFRLQTRRRCYTYPAVRRHCDPIATTVKARLVRKSETWVRDQFRR
jgi:hypothetical protein